MYNFAIFLEIKPVLLGAVLSALALDFIFIKPYFTLHIDKAEDFLLLVLFFIIALINAVLTTNFRRMQRAIQVKQTRASTLKLYNTLLDSLSHELRTPITVITGALELMEQSDLSTDDLRAVDRARRATVEMKSTIEMFLCLARETDDGLYDEHFPVTPLVNRAIEQLRYLLNGKCVDVDVDNHYKFENLPEISIA